MRHLPQQKRLAQADLASGRQLDHGRFSGSPECLDSVRLPSHTEYAAGPNPHSNDCGRFVQVPLLSVPKSVPRLPNPARPCRCRGLQRRTSLSVRSIEHPDGVGSGIGDLQQDIGVARLIQRAEAGKRFAFERLTNLRHSKRITARIQFKQTHSLFRRMHFFASRAPSDPMRVAPYRRARHLDVIRRHSPPFRAAQLDSFRHLYHLISHQRE